MVAAVVWRTRPAHKLFQRTNYQVVAAPRHATSALLPLAAVAVDAAPGYWTRTVLLSDVPTKRLSTLETLAKRLSGGEDMLASK